MSISMTQPGMSPQLVQRLLQCVGSEQAFAFGFALLLHLLITSLLFSQWQETKLPEPNVQTIKVQMLIQPKQSQPAPSVIQPSPVLHEPQLQLQPKQAVKPVESAHTVSDAKFAKKRIDEDKAEQETPTQPSNPADQPIAKPLESAVTTEKSAPVKTSDNTTEAKAKPSSEVAPDNGFDVSQYAPVSKEAPSYPQRALDKGVQGTCTVQYTVNTQGLVENAGALSDCHPLFIKPSLDATKSFRYAPRVVDGKPVSVHHVKNTFQYRIQ